MRQGIHVPYCSENPNIFRNVKFKNRKMKNCFALPQ